MEEKPKLQKIHGLPLDDWYAVGLKLGMSAFQLDTIERENRDKVKDQIREMFSKWLKTDVEATYRKLLQILQIRKETEAATKLASQIGVNIDGLRVDPGSRPSQKDLEAKPELAVIIDVAMVDEWYSIGLDLGVSEEALKCIKSNRRGDINAMKRDMLRKWLQTTKASYKALIDVLKAKDLNDAAKDLMESLGHRWEDDENPGPPANDPRPPLVITIQPQSLKVPYGSKATLSCAAVGLPGQVIIYEWYKGGTKIPSGTSGDHVITGVTCEDEGQYHCVVSCGGCKVESDRVKLEVELGDCCVAPGDDNTDHCMVSSDGGKTKVKAYKMKSKPFHGIALVISNVEFKKGCGLEDRNGGEVDEVNVTKLLGPDYLKYKVVLLKNLTARQIDFAFRLVSGYEGTTYANLPEEMKEPLKELNSKENLIAADHDSFICVLMSHGDDGTVHGTDGRVFELRNFYNYLGPCKHLEGKPKMAFIQACRGDNKPYVPPVQSDGPPSVQSDGPSRYTEHTCDFLLSYSAFFEQKSFRHRDQGAFYINALCTVFKNNYKQLDVLSMTTLIHDEVTRNINQCPQHQATLRCKVHFAVSGDWGW